MEWISISFTILGLILFEVVSSIDNAIINAEVLSTMQARARRWFLLWGLLIAVFLVRGLLPWLIVYLTAPGLGLLGSLTATFSSDESVHKTIEAAAPMLMAGGGTFLVLLFFNWLFLETKNFGLFIEPFFLKNGVWFYAFASIFLLVVVWLALKVDQAVAFATVVGSSAFFITSGFKHNAEASEKQLKNNAMSDLSKLFYLEIIDMTFSIDGVLGAFAFTMSVPLIILGNGVGAFVVREMTVRNITKIGKYRFLKNGAMYSILVLGSIMLLEGFHVEVPSLVSPLSTFAIVGFFWIKSLLDIKKNGSEQV